MKGKGHITLAQVMGEALRKWVRVEPPRIRPSSIGYCQRRNFFFHKYHAFIGEEFVDTPLDNLNDAYDTGFLASGKVYEAMLTPIFIKHGFNEQALIVIDKEREFYGHADFVKYDDETDTMYIIDLKTTAFSHLPFLPNDGNVMQLQLYLHGALFGEVWLTDDNGEPLAKLPRPSNAYGALFYIIRENPAYVSPEQEHWFSYDPDIVEKAFALRDELEKYIERDEVPPIPRGYSPYNFPCLLRGEARTRWCPYWKYCWQDVVNESDSEFGDIVEQLVRKKVEYENVSKEFKHLREMFLQMTSSRPRVHIISPYGTITKYTKTDNRVNLEAFINHAINEGLLTEEQVEAIKKAVSVPCQYTYLKVTPNYERFPDLRRGGEQDDEAEAPKVE